MSKQKFAETLLAAGTVYDKPVSEELVRIYLTVMGDVNIPEATEALTRLMRTSRFMPKPSDIIDAMQGDGRAKAMLAWPEVAKKCSNIDRAKSDDPITEVVVAQMGGWKRFGHADYSEHPFLQKEFQERYEEYVTNGATLEIARNNLLGERTGLKKIGVTEEEDD